MHFVAETKQNCLCNLPGKISPGTGRKKKTVTTFQIFTGFVLHLAHKESPSRSEQRSIQSTVLDNKLEVSRRPRIVSQA